MGGAIYGTSYDTVLNGGRKDLEANTRGLIEALYRNLPGSTKENQADVQAKIRIHHLSIISLEFYCYTNLLGGKLWSLYSLRNIMLCAITNLGRVTGN
jgi:hypothetical protein